MAGLIFNLKNPKKKNYFSFTLLIFFKKLAQRIKRVGEKKKWKAKSWPKPAFQKVVLDYYVNEIGLRAAHVMTQPWV